MQCMSYEYLLFFVFYAVLHFIVLSEVKLDVCVCELEIFMYTSLNRNDVIRSYILFGNSYVRFLANDVCYMFAEYIHFLKGWLGCEKGFNQNCCCGHIYSQAEK